MIKFSHKRMHFSKLFKFKALFKVKSTKINLSPTIPLYKCKIANTRAIRQQAAHTTFQLSYPRCSTGAYVLMNTGEFSGGKVRRMGHQQKKARAEIATGKGRKIRDRTGKGNQMTALRFQTGGGGDIRHPSLPSGDVIMAQSLTILKTKASTG